VTLSLPLSPGTNPLTGMVLVLLLVGAISNPANAQQAWQVDRTDSVATLSLGEGLNALQVGLARVTGRVEFGSSVFANPIITLAIGGSKDKAEYATMSFVSTSSSTLNTGKVIVTGDLSVTRVSREVTMSPNEAYAGPQYGPPVAHTSTHQITFVFSTSREFSAHDDVIRWSGMGIVSRETFPQFVDAITLDDWPSFLINDEKCTVPSTIAEDYHGPDCTGTVIASVSNITAPTGEPSGEGFYGFEPIVTPDRNHATISLNLQLKQMATRVSSN